MNAEELKAHAEGLFCSRTDASDDPSWALVRDEAWVWLTQLGVDGCAAVVAQEFGDHPEAAVARMCWCRRVVREAFDTAHV